jgi:alcohol dehydrogenase class IV
MSPFEFAPCPRIIFGAGRFAESGTAARQLGQRALVVSDPFCAGNGLTARLRAALTSAGVDSVLFDRVVPNPTTTSVDEAADLARAAQCDCVVGLGGGSSLDTAKGAAVAATHPGGVWDYAIGTKAIDGTPLPVLAIPTTSGTGSHATCYAVITNPATSQKPGMGSPRILPRTAIVDPELMLTMPAGLTAITGFDAFTHAVEAYTSKAACPLSDLFAERSIELTARHLRSAVRDGRDLEARAGMALADTCAGIAICHAVVSLGHVIAHVIGGHYHDIAHGDALATIYREVLRLNARGEPEKHSRIARTLVPGCDDVVEAFDQFFAGMPFERRLCSKAPGEAELRAIATDTFTYMKGIAELNPVAATAEDAYAILSASLRPRAAAPALTARA